jgi:hypothetical protein
MVNEEHQSRDPPTTLYFPRAVQINHVIIDGVDTPIYRRGSYILEIKSFAHGPNGKRDHRIPSSEASANKEYHIRTMVITLHSIMTY